MVTGHTGFKGSWLSLWLSLLGAKVLGFSIGVPSKPNHFGLIRPDIKSVKGDILNFNKIETAINNFKPDIIFHLAAQPIVSLSYISPVETIKTNVMGTVNVLECCRKIGTVKAIVNVTSDKCYKNTETSHSYIEDDKLGGNDPYSASKACSEILSQAYRMSFFNADKYKDTHSTLLANVRAGNVIGGGDWAIDRLVPDVMRAAAKGTPVVIRNPNSIRPWQHVLDPISGYLQIGQRLLAGQKEFATDWNFGPTKNGSMSVGKVVSNMERYWDKINYVCGKGEARFHEAKLLTLNSAKARKVLGWHSVWDTDKVLEVTARWYKDYYELKKINSRDDLDKFIADARKTRAAWI